MKTLRVIYRYLQDDPECNSDCEGFQIIADGKLIDYAEAERLKLTGSMWEARYPKGELDSFILGVRLAAPDCEIITEEVADLEC